MLKSTALAILIGAAIGAPGAALAQSLLHARTTEDAAAHALAAPDEAAFARLRDAALLGASTPEALLFATLDPSTPPRRAAGFCGALTEATPLSADRIVATALAATAATRRTPLVELCVRATLRALFAANLSEEAKQAESREVLAALIALLPEEEPLALAALVASGAQSIGDAAALLAALEAPPAPAAIGGGPSFLDPQTGAFVVAPSTPAQDAPSGN